MFLQMINEFEDLMADSSKIFHRKMSEQQLKLQEEFLKNRECLAQWGLLEVANGETNRQKIMWYVQQRLKKIRQNLHFEMENYRLQLQLEKQERDLAIHDHCRGRDGEIAPELPHLDTSDSSRYSEE